MYSIDTFEKNYDEETRAKDTRIVVSSQAKLGQITGNKKTSIGLRKVILDDEKSIEKLDIWENRYRVGAQIQM